MLAGRIAICDQIKFELLHSAPSASEFAQLREDLDRLPQIPITVSQWSRALQVYELIGRTHPRSNHHRSVKQADLLIAATAEAAGVAVVHYDRDFDQIAQITGQPARWVVPRGSVA
jgi:hypothetical protein